MKLLGLLIASSLLAQVSIAQNGYGTTSVYDHVVEFPKGKHLFVLPANAKWEKQRWADSVFLYPTFQEGKIELATGVSPTNTLRMNLNILLGTVEIAAPDKTITTLTKTTDIKTVWMGKHKFIYEPSFGYLEIIVDGQVSVGIRRFMNGLYELSNGYKYSLNSGPNYFASQASKNTRYYWVEEHFIIIDQRGKSFRATKGVIGRMLPQVKKQVKAFEKENKIDYSREDDLKKIAIYANEISLSN